MIMNYHNYIHMIIYLIFLFLAIITYSLESPIPQCYQELVYSQTCLWYPRCLQQKYNCGNKGYPMEYGFKYCTKFGQLDTFPAARLWIQKTLVCLKQRMIYTLNDDAKYSCHQIKKIAFDTHPICYQEAGFCHLLKQLGDKDYAIFVKQLLGIFEAKDFESISAIKQIEQVAKQCLKQMI